MRPGYSDIEFEQGRAAPVAVADGPAANELVVSAFPPSVTTGRGLRTYAIVRALSATALVELLYVDVDGSDPGGKVYDLPGVTLTPIRPSRRLSRAASYGRALQSGVPEPYARGISAELVAAIRSRIASSSVTRLIADGPIPCATTSIFASQRAFVYLAHNIESSVWASVGGRSRRALTRIRRFEQSLLDRASESWIASDADLALAAEMCPTARLRYVPNAIDVQAIAPVVPASGRDALLMVGDFTYAPNRQGAEFLVNAVMPHVWKTRPSARVLLVGRGDPPASSDPRVEVRGPVADLAAVYSEVRCAVVPLRSGGGSPLKFIEAMAYGIPVVASSRAAAGLRVTPWEHYAEADGAEDFARAVAAQLSEPDRTMAAKARALVESEYSIERLRRLLQDDA